VLVKFTNYKLFLFIGNVSAISLLFIVFDLIFRFLRFSLIYLRLNSLWTVYSDYYFILAFAFGIIWIASSILLIFFLRQKTIKWDL
tara:strand:+ start:860 stop:1117 length:258 start_codon:yes stop_codon:yes gene_type:complete